LTLVREVMTTHLHYVAPSTRVGEAVAIMAQYRIGSVLVMEGARLVGIFTERDTVRALARSPDAPDHPVSKWMTQDPVTVTPDIPSQETLRTMLDAGFRHLPVIEAGEVAGIVSIRDLSR
jgi:CBS domain-containing protein